MKAIAIDGPSGAGKSTLARRLAADLGFIYVDTGALYRAVGLFAKQHGIPYRDEAALAPRLDEIEMELVWRGGEQRVLLNERDVSDDIRAADMGMAASDVSALPAVRAFLLETQRGMARRQNVIMDGRDIGTVVLPQADLKIFLTATPEDRARRRLADFAARGDSTTYEEVLADIRRRDAQDTGRAIAPLRQAEDAVRVDTTGLRFEQSLARLTALCREIQINY